MNISYVYIEMSLSESWDDYNLNISNRKDINNSDYDNSDK